MCTVNVAFTPQGAGQFSASIQMNGASSGLANFGLSGTATASASSYSISGNVAQNGTALPGLTVSLSTGQLTTKDGMGNYSFSGLASGSTVTVTPSFGTDVFIPGSYTFQNLSSNVQGNFSVSKGLLFVPITPCRAVDTRGTPGAFGGPELAAGSVHTFNLPSGQCNIPATALAYSLNITVVPAGRLGYLTIWPAGQTQPVVSTLNSDGRVKANAAIVEAGTNGGVSVFVTNSTQLVIDVNGYFVAQGRRTRWHFTP